jgi:hypothetical protein
MGCKVVRPMYNHACMCSRLLCCGTSAVGDVGSGVITDPVLINESINMAFGKVYCDIQPMPFLDRLRISPKSFGYESRRIPIWLG